MEDLPVWAAGLSGALIGGAVGFATRRGRLCSFGAIEDAFMGGDTRRLKVFGFALAVAMMGSQALIFAGLFDPGQTGLLSPTFAWLSMAIGGAVFGLGMALVGTCGLGSLVRLGGGDLRSLIVLGVIGLTAYASLRGVLAEIRIAFIERVFVQIAVVERADLPNLIEAWTGLHARLAATLAISSALAGLALIDARLRRSPRLLAAGAVLGLGVAAAWGVTGLLADEFAGASRPQGLTFIAPVGKLLYAAMTGQRRALDFGVGAVLGVAIGGFVSAMAANEFRWEAFDDDREMRRHLAGAAFMGAGGVLCGGCTIGQGVSAGSLLALSWPLSVGGMILGARFGIYLLMGGTLVELLRTGLRKAIGSATAAGK